jgi:hypothetical protein
VKETGVLDTLGDRCLAELESPRRRWRCEGDLEIYFGEFGGGREQVSPVQPSSLRMKYIGIALHS